MDHDVSDNYYRLYYYYYFVCIIAILSATNKQETRPNMQKYHIRWCWEGLAIVSVRILTVFDETERMRNADVIRGKAEGDISVMSINDRQVLAMCANSQILNTMTTLMVI